MRSVVNNPSPNIVPGINLTAARFQELYAWIQSLASDTVQAALQPNEYGLLAPFDGKAALDLKKVGSRLILKRCCGITPQGATVGIFEGYTPTLQYELNLAGMQPGRIYQVVLEVENSSRTPFGPDATDLPKRPLYSLPAIQLTVQPLEQELGFRPDAFRIGLLAIKGGEWHLEEYIPPCMNLNADPTLRHRYIRYQEGLKILLEEMPKIVRQTDSFQEKSMIELREFALQLGSLLAGRQHCYRKLEKGGHPYQVFELWAAFAQLASFLLQCLTDRTGFYHVINENTRGVNGVFFTPKSLDDAIRSLANLEYSHNDILDAVALTDHFLDLVIPIFKGLGISTMRLPTREATYTKSTPPQEAENKDKSLTW